MISYLNSEKENEPCLIVSINQIFYGIKTSRVKEITELPELKSLPNFPIFFAGILDYKGITVPIINAKDALGCPQEDYLDTDVLIVIEENGELFGIILPSLFDVPNLQMMNESHFSQFITDSRTDYPIIREVSKYKDSLVFIFDTKAILAELNAVFSNQSAPTHDKENGHTVENNTQGLHYNLFMNRVPQLLRELFMQRAKQLSEKALLKSDAETISITILKILEKTFAIESEKIKEFCYLSDYAPIPTQEKLLGFMNLRGSILPLVDIWYLLHGERIKVKSLSKVLVLEFIDGMVGFLVEEADKVMSIETADFCELPFNTNNEVDPFIKRGVRVENHIIGLLDTEKLIQALL